MVVPLKMGKRRHRWGWRGNDSGDGEEEAVAGVEEDEGMGLERIRWRGSRDVETAVQWRPGWKGGVAPARRGGVAA
ncbi:Os06g0273150 [Oryza sativa Japonica Group]|uniref:Os06g0273150 protein n=4 Tax=Oryza TaxID=4527 RepID=A0A0P0WV50_ORYSJ|nr:Os06g0273150 [Oryza sativa Japonica Group]